MIVITLLFGVFYLVDLQNPQGKFGPQPKDPTKSIALSREDTKPCPSVPESERMSTLEKQVPLYIITATFPRLEQLAELTRLGQTLKHAKNIMWIVADDASTPTKQVMQLLHRLNITHKYLLGNGRVHVKKTCQNK